MAAELPLNRLVLAASSIADDLSYVALADLWQAIAEQELQADARLIGGHMVTLHAYRWGLGSELYRESRDADLGLPQTVARDPRVVVALMRRGYERRGGNTFVKLVSDVAVSPKADAGPFEAAIDILVAPYTSRVGENVRLGDHLTSTEVPGLAEALRRPPVEVSAEFHRLEGERREAIVVLPDEASTVILRAFAWRTRGVDTDAVDLWRSLEVAAAAGVTAGDFKDGRAPEAAQIARTALADRRGHAMGQLARARGLPDAGARNLHTRIRALAKRIFED